MHERVAHQFYDWLIALQYCDENDKIEDIKDVIKDFEVIQKEAPKLFNLLNCISS